MSGFTTEGLSRLQLVGGIGLGASLAIFFDQIYDTSSGITDLTAKAYAGNLSKSDSQTLQASLNRKATIFVIMGISLIVVGLLLFYITQSEALLKTLWLTLISAGIIIAVSGISTSWDAWTAYSSGNSASLTGQKASGIVGPFIVAGIFSALIFFGGKPKQ